MISTHLKSKHLCILEKFWLMISTYIYLSIWDHERYDYDGLSWSNLGIPYKSTLQPQALKCFHPQQPSWNDFGDASVVYIWIFESKRNQVGKVTFLRLCLDVQAVYFELHLKLLSRWTNKCYWSIHLHPSQLGPSLESNNLIKTFLSLKT